MNGLVEFVSNRNRRLVAALAVVLYLGFRSIAIDLDHLVVAAIWWHTGWAWAWRLATSPMGRPFHIPILLADGVLVLLSAALYCGWGVVEDMRRAWIARNVCEGMEGQQ